METTANSTSWLLSCQHATLADRRNRNWRHSRGRSRRRKRKRRRLWTCHYLSECLIYPGQFRHDPDVAWPCSAAHPPAPAAPDLLNASDCKANSHELPYSATSKGITSSKQRLRFLKDEHLGTPVGGSQAESS